VFIVTLLIVLIRRLYHVEIIDGKIINEYINRKLIKTTMFDKIEGVKSIYCNTFFTNIERLRTIDRSRPLVYGTKNGEYIECIFLHGNPDWNDFLKKMKENFDDLIIDPSLSKYISIDMQKKIFGKTDKFQVFFIILITATFLAFFLTMLF
jgi:hypothetical protein